MDELTAEQKGQLQNKLLVLKDELELLLKQSSASSQVVALDQPIGRLSRMDALQQQAMAVANRAGFTDGDIYGVQIDRRRFACPSPDLEHNAALIWIQVWRPCRPEISISFAAQ